tara:strand:+ start:832 stop:1392 length:561 start_codon:yes stop_codon:yes gene_type:complete
MRIYISLLIFLCGVSNGSQKNEGLILQKKTYKALIPFGQNIVIYGIDDNESIEGELVNVSRKEIYLKDITTNKMTSIPIHNVKEIRSFAKPKKYENFKTGFSRGVGIASIATTGAIAILTLDRPEEFHYALFFAMVIVPPAAIVGGILDGLSNMSLATNQIKDTDLFKINDNSWKILQIPNGKTPL